MTLVNFLLDRQVGSSLNLISSVNNLDNADFVQRLKGNREGGPWQIELHDQDCNHKNILHFLWFSFLPKHTKKITLPDIGSCFTWPSWRGVKEGGITKDTQVFLLSFIYALWQQSVSIKIIFPNIYLEKWPRKPHNIFKQNLRKFFCGHLLLCSVTIKTRYEVQS